MAKIIGYKKIFKPQYKVCCNNCGAIIIFDKDEVSDDYQYNEYCYTKGICPECGKSIYFDKNKLIITEETQKRKCGNFCHYYKGNKCTYKGTDWRECPR